MPKNNEKLRNPFNLGLNELPLKEIKINNEDVCCISEDDFEKYMIKNCFNIYDINNKSLNCYGDILNNDLVTDYGLLYDVAYNLGLTLVSIDNEMGDEYKEFNNYLLTEENIRSLKKLSSSSIVFLISKE